MSWEDEEDAEFEADIDTGRRVELKLSDELLVTLQYFSGFDNISLSFYAKNSPGYTICVRTRDWPMIQNMIAKFCWSGFKH